MTALITPASVSELIDAVRSCPQLLTCGNGTKPRLSTFNVTKVSTSKLTGIVEYDPSEFTFTAKAGTLLSDLVVTLAASGQYLPFEPVLADAGATLAGTVAAGVSGPGRLRFGGLRDFILGVQFVDGLGRALRVGGKVVKNAAGFDLPKFFVGSLGRFGVLSELTFKVFPAPSSSLSLKLEAKNAETATRVLLEAPNARWEPHAVDILPGGYDVCLRLGGPAPALEKIAQDILARWPGKQLSSPEAQAIWSELREFRWAHANGVLVKVAVTPVVLSALYKALELLDGVQVHVSAAGNVAFISIPASNQSTALSEKLRNLSLSALTLRGEAPLWCGEHKSFKIEAAVKHALDPQARFPGLDQ